MGEKRNTYRVLVGKPEGKRQLGRLRHRRKNNIMMKSAGFWGNCLPHDAA
jgi:hypothetical protein